MDFMLTFRINTLFFYALPIAYYVMQIGHVGDIQQGGTVLAWLGLQALAVVILLGVWVLWPQVGKIEKGVLVLCAIYPLIGLTYAVLSYVGY